MKVYFSVTENININFPTAVNDGAQPECLLHFDLELITALQGKSSKKNHDGCISVSLAFLPLIILVKFLSHDPSPGRALTVIVKTRVST